MKKYVYGIIFCWISLNNLTPEEEATLKKVQDIALGEITTFNPESFLNSLQEIGELLKNSKSPEDRKLLVLSYQQIFIKNILFILFTQLLHTLFEEKEYISFQEFWQEDSYEFLKPTYGFLDDEERGNLNQRIMKASTFFDTYFNPTKPPFTLIHSNKVFKNEKNFHQLFFLYISSMLNTTLLISNPDLFPLPLIQEQLKTISERLKAKSKELLKPEIYQQFISAKMPQTALTLVGFLKHFENDPAQEIPVLFNEEDILNLSDDLLYIFSAL